MLPPLSRGHFDRSDLKLGPQLTQEDVSELPDGSPVFITWCGGNGPHRYYIVRRDGVVYAAMKPAVGDDERLGYDAIVDCVGTDRINTRVWLPEREKKGGET
jgi:hypothetical protein